MKEAILVPMAFLSNLGMLSVFKAMDNVMIKKRSLLRDNRGEVNPTPEPEPTPTPEPTQEPTPEPEPTPGAFDSFVQKKGFKDNDAIAKSYEEIEASYHRNTNTMNSVKQQLESAGYAMDDKGVITQTGQPAYQQLQQPYQSGQGQPEPIYDPYTGQQITNPLDAQLAAMPLSQRMGVVYNAMADQREKQTAASFAAEQKVLNTPEAKGFEQDVRNVMMQVPLANRSTDDAWEKALFEVKGRRYDSDRKNWGKQGVDDFINKEGAQGLPGAGGGGVSVKLTPEQEKTYKWYQDTRPEMFKDKAHFLKACSPTGGR